MDNEKQTVEMTAAEAEQFAAFKEAQAKKEAEAKKKADREAYAKLVDETIASSMPQLRDISQAITERKRLVMSNFKTALELKADIFGVKDNQRSHTFTNSEGTARITLGQYQLDNYKDTVNEGIAIVKEYIQGLAKDETSAQLVKMVMSLLARNANGALKASRITRLMKLAEESGNDRFIEGVKIIQAAYRPAVSRTYIRCEVRNIDPETQVIKDWEALPLGMTES